MNEDDTFAALKRISFEEMQTKLMAFAFSHSMKSDYNTRLSAFMRENEWDLEVFKAILQKRIDEMRNELERR